LSTGALLYPVGYIFLDDDGVPVNAGRLYAYRTGTTTEQDTYSDSTLDTANANPVVLNSSGRCTTAIYGDPSSGYDYRLTLKTSADSQIWQYDDVVVAGADAATYVEGSFTGTLTGMDASTTGTVTYRIVANADGTGKIVYLSVATLTGTSNSTAMTMTGLPAAVTPSAARNAPLLFAVDNGANVSALAAVGTNSTIVFYTDEPLSSTGWTSSGTKGLTNSVLTYVL
jgi:hypothetical protein